MVTITYIYFFIYVFRTRWCKTYMYLIKRAPTLDDASQTFSCKSHQKKIFVIVKRVDESYNDDEQLPPSSSSSSSSVQPHLNTLILRLTSGQHTRYTGVLNWSSEPGLAGSKVSLSLSSLSRARYLLSIVLGILAQVSRA